MYQLYRQYKIKLYFYLMTLYLFLRIKSRKLYKMIFNDEKNKNI